MPDDACMAQAAVNASLLCGASVFFPPSDSYSFVRPVFIEGPGVSIIGSERLGGGGVKK